MPNETSHIFFPTSHTHIEETNEVTRHKFSLARVTPSGLLRSLA